MEKIYDELVNKMLEQARQDYSKTTEAALYWNPVSELEQEFADILRPAERKFVEEEYLPMADKAAERQEAWVYRRGFLDCINILKHFGILA